MVRETWTRWYQLLLVSRRYVIGEACGFGHSDLFLHLHTLSKGLDYLNPDTVITCKIISRFQLAVLNTYLHISILSHQSEVAWPTPRSVCYQERRTTKTKDTSAEATQFSMLCTALTSCRYIRTPPGHPRDVRDHWSWKFRGKDNHWLSTWLAVVHHKMDVLRRTVHQKQVPIWFEVVQYF